jgi:hypothetical protein
MGSETFIWACHLMLPLSPAWNVEYLTRLTAAMSAIESGIRQHIPEGITLKDRPGRVAELRPGEAGYGSLLKKFTENVSDLRSIVVLTFLYQHEKYLSSDVEIFTRQYQKYFEKRSAKWQAVLYNYPRIDQTALSIILNTISETLIGYRLEDLSRIGLVERSTLPPPHPKHVRISEKGIAMFNDAIKDGAAHLAPIFEGAESLLLNPNQEQTSPEHSDNGQGDHRAP